MVRGAFLSICCPSATTSSCDFQLPPSLCGEQVGMLRPWQCVQWLEVCSARQRVGRRAVQGRPGLLRTVLEQQETRGLTRSDDLSRLLPSEVRLLPPPPPPPPQGGRAGGPRRPVHGGSSWLPHSLNQAFTL